MRMISRTNFREILTSSALGTLLFTFVLFLKTIERLSAMLVRSSPPTYTVVRLFIYALPATIPFSLPLRRARGVRGFEPGESAFSRSLSAMFTFRPGVPAAAALSWLI